MGDTRGVDLEGSEDGKDMGLLEEKENANSICYMRKEYILFFSFLLKLLFFIELYLFL